MLQITRQSEYAVRTLLELAQIPFGRRMSTKIISEKQEISEVFLKKTIQQLDRVGLVATHRGKQGGVQLCVPADEITIADVIGAIEGEVAINPCLSEKNHCKNEEFCPVHQILERAQDALLAELKRETFADIVKGKVKAEE